MAHKYRNIHYIFLVFLATTLLAACASTVAQRPQPSLDETGRDGDYIAYSDNTVVDTASKLMWAASDNGKPIDWYDAKNFCEMYRGGGYKDWRLPTSKELVALYGAGKVNAQGYHVTNLISLSSYALWSVNAYEKQKSLHDKDGAGFVRFDQQFNAGIELLGYKSMQDERIFEIAFAYRVLPVRDYAP